ncbi:MAG: BolA family protein [Rubrivivax sp.]|jgi:BolA protein
MSPADRPDARPAHWLGGVEIEARLREALSPETLEVLDDSGQHAGHVGAREGGHWTVRIRSARFAGLSRPARHRLVYDALGPLLAQGIHALAIEARAPGEA